MSINQFRIGIVGGMGPQAGVLLQQYIIEETLADDDQQHLQVVTFTNPQIPDRTKSLQEDGGGKTIEVIVNSIKTLERTGVTVIAMPCVTAHARLGEIQEQVSTPLVDMVQLVIEQLEDDVAVGLLATDGTIREQVIQAASNKTRWVTPGVATQQQVMSLIYSVKSSRGKISGNQKAQLQSLVENLQTNGASKVVLGCTELSVIYFGTSNYQQSIVDPLRLLARHLVSLYL